MRKLVVPLLLLIVYLVARPTGATAPADARGHVGLALMLRKLATVGTVLHATAHPDDENNGLLAMQSHGQGLRVVLATATRGNGGQNEIGPELFEALGVLRTEELLAAHAFDGAEQMFGLSVDFGYSFSIEETFEKWGREAALGDFVRLIRATRPDVVITMKPTGAGGGQHHQASAVLATEAFRAAADPNRFPEQVREGLRPWQSHKLYQVARYGFFRGEEELPPGVRVISVDTEVYDPLLGRTYTEIGSEARAMHKSQGFGQLLALPGSFAIKYRLADTTVPGQQGRDEQSLLDGLDLSLASLARFAGPMPPPTLTDRLAAIAGAVDRAGAALRAHGTHAAVEPLARGLQDTRVLLAWLAHAPVAADGRAEIAFRLSQTAAKFEKALVLAQGLRLEALADAGVVVSGQAVQVALTLANRGAEGVVLEPVTLAGFETAVRACDPGPLAAGANVTCKATVTVPPDAEPTGPYWERIGEAGRYVVKPGAPVGLPFAPTPFLAEFPLTIGGVPVRVRLPVVHRYEGNIFSGEKRMELHVVPPLSAALAPDVAVVSTSAPAPREVRVTVASAGPGATDARIGVEVPPGWRVDPAEQALSLPRPGAADTASFRVVPPQPLVPGRAGFTASVVAGGRRFTRGYQVVEYPHTRRRHIFQPAAAVAQAIELRVPRDLRVGYVMGVGDQVPPALEQIGARVDLLDAAQLAQGELSVYDAIMTGVRAYERRADLRAYNHRLLDYARRGGTVLVQYNKFEFNQSQYGPWPVKVSSNRVTDERAPVTVLDPQHPVFTRPNPIGPAAWGGWVQERGLYFLGERDPRYVDLVALADPFPFNAGERRGALVEARVGEGRWIYVGLNLWRQLPAGTPGAYQLLANLVSLSRAE